MARIEGVDLPRNKRIDIGLRYIYGIGPKKADEILAATGVDPTIRVKDLPESEVTKLRDYIAQNLKVEGDLRREVQMNIKRLVEIGCYRGLRHRRNLPLRGQNTRTNARTRKGPKKTVAGRGRRRGAKK
ncbi:MAG: 30S ribosomal protein S13 [Chloroflexi bacterium]|jgi:small subunit ribosomal protein S13|nr:30S ribosomal protein S13 [Chloroflexota bacterium]